MAKDVFHRIVTPTDFSDCAEEAWRLTQRVAEPLGSEIVLAHVFAEPPLYGDPPGLVTAWQVVAETEKWVTDELEKWAKAARKRQITVRTVVLRGAPSVEIVKLASDEHADLISMGTHGRGGVSRALLGSVADRVIRTAACPVLTVRKPD